MKQRKGATNILYGMDSGALSSVTVQPDGTHTHLWTVEEAAKRSPVTCTYSALCDLCHIEGPHSYINCRLSSKLFSYIFMLSLSPCCCCSSSLSYSVKNSCIFLSSLREPELSSQNSVNEPITDEHDKQNSRN